MASVFLNTTWVHCDDCGKWRHLVDVHDPSTLPDRWSCQLNHDDARNSCDKAEEQHNFEDDDPQYKNFVDTEFSVGSLVWARQSGHIWWPAMVYPDPENHLCLCLDEEDNVSAYYVLFFGWNGECAWVGVERVKAFAKWSPKTSARQDLHVKKTCQGWNGKKMQLAREEIGRAADIPDVQERLRTFGRIDELVGGESGKPAKKGCSGRSARIQRTVDEVAAGSGKLPDSAPKRKRKRMELDKSSSSTPIVSTGAKSKRKEKQPSSSKKGKKSVESNLETMRNLVESLVEKVVLEVRKEPEKETLALAKKNSGRQDEQQTMEMESLPQQEPQETENEDGEVDLETFLSQLDKDAQDAAALQQQTQKEIIGKDGKVKPFVAVSEGTPLAPLQIPLRPQLSTGAQMKKLQMLSAKLDETTESKSDPAPADKPSCFKPQFGKKLKA